MSNLECKAKAHGIGFGLFVILVGGVLLAVNAGYVPDVFRTVFISWQMLLIAIGVLVLFQGRWQDSFILFAVGGFFILPKLAEVSPAFSWVHPDFVYVNWPILIVLLGFFLILKVLFLPRQLKCFANRWADKHTTTESSVDGFVERSVMFGEVNQIFLAPEFKGGRVEASVGELRLDLRKTTLPEGRTVLDVNASFGSIVIIVPADWAVELNVSSSFGEFADKRYDLGTVQPGKTLVITGRCTFAGGELRN